MVRPELGPEAAKLFRAGLAARAAQGRRLGNPQPDDGIIERFAIPAEDCLHETVEASVATTGHLGAMPTPAALSGTSSAGAVTKFLH